MRIKRKEAADPQWRDWEYAVISKEDLFHPKRWKRTVEWEIILKHVERMRQASQMIDISSYPSKLFFIAIDQLEANLYVLHDLFYYLTGVRLSETNLASEEELNPLSFWNMDRYKMLEQISKGLRQITKRLIDCIKQEPLWGTIHEIVEMDPFFKGLIYSAPNPKSITIMEKWAYSYSRSHYEVTKIDKEDFVTQIARIIDFLMSDAFEFVCIYSNDLDFPKLLALFRQSTKAQTDYIEPWRHDLDGTRDSLIAKMEKDPKLGPWVNRYDHLSKDKSVRGQLFSDEKDYSINEEECYNTDNWLSILTIAAVLEEYDERHRADAVMLDEEEERKILLKLSAYFNDDDCAKRFLESVKVMNDTEIITLLIKYYEAGLCSTTSKALWKLLSDAHLYRAGFSNWNGQINSSITKPKKHKG